MLYVQFVKEENNHNKIDDRNNSSLTFRVKNVNIFYTLN